MLFQGSGLFAKILLWFVTTVAVVVIVFAGTAIHLQGQAEDEHQSMIREMLGEQGRFFVFFLEATDFPEPKKFESLQFIPLWIFDRGGKLLFATRKAAGVTPAESPASPPGEAQPDLAPLVAQMAVASESFRQFTLGKRKFLGHRLSGKGGEVYVAFLRLRDKTIRHFLRTFLETWAGNWLLMGTLIIGMLCFWLAKYLVSPIMEMQRLSRTIASGDLHARLPVGLTERFDELGALATDFNAMAERIEMTIQGQRQLLWDVSHELRTPLTRLSLALELVRDAGPEKREALAARAEQNLNRLDALIQQILELARMGQMQAGPASQHPVDLRDLLRNLLADVTFEAEAQGRVVRQSLPEGEVHLRGSEELLRRALENVIRNAFQHTPREATISVGLSVHREGEKDLAIIEIRDTGPGVPDDQLTQIFEPFFRGPVARESAEKSTSGKPDRQIQDHQGVGLGLAIARRAVEAHQGSICARNADGGGLVVEIRLPRKA